LKTIAPSVKEDDVTTFLAAPEAIIKQLESQAWEEYKAYIDTLPPSVGNSIKFTFDAGEKVRALHKTLPQNRSFFFTENVCKIDKGVCVVDTEELKRRCTISGSDEVASVWEECKTLAATLNRLESKIQTLSKRDMHLLEQPRSLNMGLIQNTNGSYSLDLDRLSSLADSANA